MPCISSASFHSRETGVWNRPGMYQRSARPIWERWQMHSEGQPQCRPLGLWSLPTMLMGEVYASSSASRVARGHSGCFAEPSYLARKGAAALLGALLAALLFQGLLRGLLRELLRLLLTFHRAILRRRAGGQKKGRPAGRPLMRFPYVSAAQASGQAQSHIGPSRRFRPPPEGGYLQTTRSGAAARLRFCSPVREIRSNPLGPAAGRPFV
jgi:hypothetical protein